MDDLRVAKGSKGQEILVTRHEHVGLGDRGQRRQKVVVRIAADVNLALRRRQRHSSHEVGDFGALRRIEQAPLGRARDHVLKLVDELRRRDKNQATDLNGSANLPPPPFDQGADQDGRVEDRADSGFSRRTS